VCACPLQARDINLDIKRVVAYRYWCNKLWNAIRFAMMNLPEGFSALEQATTTQQLSSWPHAAQWILSRLNQAVDAVNKVSLDLSPGRIRVGVRPHSAHWCPDHCVLRHGITCA
jgi:valyl-tRNA synthetase